MSEPMIDDPMTGAELRVVREHLGLTTRWVADTLGTAERSVHRWEAGERPVPDGVRQTVESWEATTARVVGDVITQLEDASDHTVATYRTDADYRAAHPELAWPASWHRAMLGRVADEVPGLSIMWARP